MRLEQKSRKTVGGSSRRRCGNLRLRSLCTGSPRRKWNPRRATSRYSFIHRCGSCRKTTSHQPKRKTGHYSGQYYFGRLDMYLSHHHVPVIMKLSQCADIVQDYMESHPQYSYHYFENISTAEEYHSSHQAELKRRVFPYFSLMIIFNEQTRKDDSAK